jgi:O-acetyl-ADP-ribose deacetylase (regulator of RNase III)
MRLEGKILKTKIGFGKKFFGISIPTEVKSLILKSTHGNNFMKELIYKDGNLLTANDVQVIGHQANCQNTFGSGIARSIYEMYYQAFNADCIAAKRKLNVLGTFSFANIGPEQSAKHSSTICRIYNLYGQNLYGPGIRRTNYEALYNALEGMANTLRATEEDLQMFDFNREPAVGFPYLMGSALGGGNWDIVSRLIEVAFDGYGSDVIIYKFTP